MPHPECTASGKLGCRDGDKSPVFGRDVGGRVPGDPNEGTVAISISELLGSLASFNFSRCGCINDSRLKDLCYSAYRNRPFNQFGSSVL